MGPKILCTKNGLTISPVVHLVFSHDGHFGLGGGGGLPPLLLWCAAILLPPPRRRLKVDML